MEKKAFAATAKELIDSGWHMRAPDADTQKFDGEACEKSACDHCGRTGLTYIPFTGPARPKPGATLSGYRAFAHCAVCGHTVEF